VCYLAFRLPTIMEEQCVNIQESKAYRVSKQDPVTKAEVLAFRGARKSVNRKWQSAPASGQQ
jgi:hypothetical protein